VVGRHENISLQLLFDDRLEGCHFESIAMDEYYLIWVDISEEIYDALCVSVGRKRNVFDPHFDLIGLLVDYDFLGLVEESVAKSALHTVARNDQSISFVSTPLLEYLYARSRVQHPWSGKQHIWSVCPDKTLVKRFYLFELEYVVTCCELFLDLFILPIREKTIVEIGLVDKTC
jgi:hypothetical protein